MILQCPYCSFNREVKLPMDILKVLAEPDIHYEDYQLWIDRLVSITGVKAYQGVKIHIGRMHKVHAVLFGLPQLNKQESAIINGTESAT